jgi:hypothetical protein
MSEEQAAPENTLTGKPSVENAWQNLNQQQQEFVSNKGWKGPEDMLNSYQNLEKAQGQKSQQQPQSSEGLSLPKPQGKQGRLLERVGLTAAQIAKDMSENNGKPSPSLVSKFEGTGLSAEDVQDLGQLAVQANEFTKHQKTQALDRANKITGGQELTDAVLAWAQQNKSVAEQDAIDAALASGAWELTFRGLYSEYQQTVQTDQGNTVQGGSPGQAPQHGNATPFTSQVEVAQAMSDKRYNNDTAYTQYVLNRMRATPKLADIGAYGNG